MAARSRSSPATAQAARLGAVRKVGKALLAQEDELGKAMASRIDCRSAPCGVTTGDDDLGAVEGQAQGDRLADAGSRTCLNRSGNCGGGFY